MKKFIIVLLVITVSAACLSSCAKSKPNPALDGIKTEAGYIDLTPELAKVLIDSTADLIIIDVSAGYPQGHLPNAVSYYLGDGTLDEIIPTLDKNKPYLVYCHGDRTSKLGAQKLIDAGFSTVYRLDGNYIAWVDAGYPVEK